jgi:DNA polymerase-3 subunit delta
MITLIHGEEEFLRAEALREQKEALESPDTADLNTTLLDGRKATLADVQMACDTVPFLAPRRLVIVTSLLDRLAGQGKARRSAAQKAYLQDLVDYLDQVPETTDLVFEEESAVARGHPLHKRVLALEKNKRARVLFCQRKRGGDLIAWIEKRARDKGGKITRDTTHQLISTVGDNLRLLDQELEKLITYAAGERAIQPGDVNLLVSPAVETNIFHMVDALGYGNIKRAILLLHQLLDEDLSPLYLLAMIVRQYRLLLQVKDLVARGLRPQAIARELKLQPWMVEKKLAPQARRYSLPQLETIYERLLAVDVDIKTGRMEPVLALDVLVAELGG